MEKDRIIQLIQAYFVDKLVEKAWFFNQFTRDEQLTDSDVDVSIYEEDRLKLTPIN